jgi:hypothetical protein
MATTVRMLALLAPIAGAARALCLAALLCVAPLSGADTRAQASPAPPSAGDAIPVDVLGSQQVPAEAMLRREPHALRASIAESSVAHVTRGSHASEACSRRTSSALHDSEVLALEDMPALAVGLLRIRVACPTLGGGIADVVATSPGEQVFGVHALPVVAAMKHAQSRRDGAVGQLIGHAMRKRHPVFDADCAVAGVLPASREDETFAVLNNLRHQAIAQSNRCFGIHSN